MEWVAHLLIMSIYMLLWILIIIGLRFSRSCKPVVTFFYFLALLNSLFPLLQYIIGMAFNKSAFYYHHGFDYVLWLIYAHFQLVYFFFNIRRLLELLFPRVLEKLLLLWPYY